MMSGQSTDIAAAGGRSIEAHLHVPGAGSGPGVILLQDVADDDRDLSELGDLYAEEGYAVLCPTGFGIAQGTEGLAAAIAALRSRPKCTGKVGVLGFGRGGKLAYLAAAEAGLDCAISYYGLDADFGLNLASRICCPLVIHLAENDPQIPPGAAAWVKEAFANRADVAVYVYPGVAPGF